MLTSLELCAGAGGQASGLEVAGFDHEGLVELDPHCCKTLKLNRPHWKVFEEDLNTFDGRAFRGIDLLAGGLPCPPFSKAGKQLGTKDERNLFPAALRLVEETQPKAIMFENVRGFLDDVFEDYRMEIKDQLFKLGYISDWDLFNASHFGVPQLRPRVVIVALKKDLWDGFKWPDPKPGSARTVGETLFDLMAENGWRGAKNWAKQANDIAPTLVGGSKKHGGPDLGPTRAKKAWATLGVDGMGIADRAPPKDFLIHEKPRLTVRMAALIQGFHPDWQFHGKKTAAYRQVGNAFPPPVACAVAEQIKKAISKRKSHPVLAVAG